MKPFIAKVVSNTVIAEDTYSVVFSTEDSFAFTSGQFVNIKLKNPDKESSLPFIMRGYSIASSLQHLPLFELCVKVVRFTDRDTGEARTGVGSGYLSRLKKGDTVEFLGPLGHFSKKSIEKKTVMVATGTGIAPMRSICEELSEHGFPLKTKLFYGVSHSEFVCYNDFFQGLADQYENFSYTLFISRSSEEEILKMKEEGMFSGVRVVSGRVTQAVKSLLEEDCVDTDFLLCGNPAMVKEVRSVLQKEKGVDRSEIVVEQY